MVYTRFCLDNFHLHLVAEFSEDFSDTFPNLHTNRFPTLLRKKCNMNIILINHGRVPVMGSCRSSFICKIFIVPNCYALVKHLPNFHTPVNCQCRAAYSISAAGIHFFLPTTKGRMVFSSKLLEMDTSP